MNRIAGMFAIILLSASAVFAKGRISEDVCARSHQGTTRDLYNKTVQICDQFYSEAPLVRLPEVDSFSNPNQVNFYGAIDMILPDQSLIADGTGQKWLVLNANGALNPVYDYSAFPAAMHMPSNMYLYLIYHFQGKITPVPSSFYNPNNALKGIVLSSAEPVIYVPGSLMDNYLLGSWEGFANLRIYPAPHSDMTFFDSNSQVPLRVHFSALKSFSEPQASEVLSVWPDKSHMGQKLLDVTVSDAVGIVENFSSDVLSSEGSCLKSLAGLNDRNPFLGATSGAVDFYRFPSMHGAGSEAMIMVFPVGTLNLAPTGMSVPFFIKASTLILRSPQFVANELPHGMHNGFEIGGFHKVSNGGGLCRSN